MNGRRGWGRGWMGGFDGGFVLFCLGMGCEEVGAYIYICPSGKSFWAGLVLQRI